MYMICRHYPNHGPLLIIYILCMVILIWQMIEGSGILASDVSLFLQFHILTAGIFVSKLLLDINFAVFGWPPVSNVS